MRMVETVVAFLHPDIPLPMGLRVISASIPNLCA